MHSNHLMQQRNRAMSMCICTVSSFRLLLSTETPVMTPYSVDFPPFLSLYSTCNLCKASKCSFTMLQARYHGIAVTVNAGMLTPVNGKPLQQAMETVLKDPTFQVSTAELPCDRHNVD